MMEKVPEELVKERNLLKRKVRALIREYEMKVTYDFSRFIYVGVKEHFNIPLEDAIGLISTCAGYEAHRVVYYKHAFASNMYVRFADQNCALAAVGRLIQHEGYCADMVSAMLVSLYLEEMLKGNFPWTLALVNIEGRAEHTDPLSPDVLKGMLMKFGDPRINTYQNGNQVEHVQVLFSSFSEALGASIVHGRWFRGFTEENPRFYYSIQIMGSEKEATILKHIQPDKRTDDQEIQAFELDFFVQKMETKTITSYMGNDFTPNSSQDFRYSPRPREFRRQFSRGKGNNRTKGNNPQWRKSQNQIGQLLPIQGPSSIQS